MQKLFTEFTPATAFQWKEQLIKELKGIDYNTLVWKTNSGIDVRPFYTKENLAENPTPVFTTPDWAICEYIPVVDEKKANIKALNALQNGASGLVFKISSKTDYTLLLKDILLEHIYCLFKITPGYEKELSVFLSSVNTRHTCFVECDDLLSNHPQFKNSSSTIAVNTTLYQEAGANTMNELAFSLAHINEYLNHVSGNTDLKNIKKIHFSVSVGGDFFMEIAKLRALRKSIEFLLKQYGIEIEIYIHAQTTLINKSSIDSYNNMLRSTTEAMSAAIGGANSILVLPFDVEFNVQNDFSSRMARNQQLILKDESYLNVVADISAGSYYIETITETLCEKAWEQFKIIESKGGLIASLKTNYIQELIKTDADELIKQFREGKLILVGINKFQNKNEEKKTKDIRLKMDENEGSNYGIKSLKLSDYLENAVAN